MIIGSWGTFIFEVSGEKAKTFSEFTEKSSGRWAEHETVNTTPWAEFLGPGLDEIEMSIILSKELGVNPQKSYEELRIVVRKGLHFPLIVDGFPINGNLWRILDISGKAAQFEPRTGKTTWMELKVVFKEYH